MISEAEKKLLVRGTQINYYFVCKTKLWLFSHHIQMEQESDVVELGNCYTMTRINGKKKV